jgi:hypothetical protein
MSGVPQDNAQRPFSPSDYRIPELQSQASPLSGLSDPAFPFVADSFRYHADRLNVRTSSQISDISPPASLDLRPQMMMSTTIPRQGGDGTYFKIPSYPSISSIMKPSTSSEENTDISSLQGIGEASPRLSQFFHPTQDSPPQLHSSPQRPLEVVHPDPITIVTPTPPPPQKSVYTPLAIIEARERKRAEEERAAEEARQKEEEDSFVAVPEHLRRRWAMEEKAHKMFEGLRSVNVEFKQTRSRFDSQMDDFLFGTKTRLDPDGVRRVIKPIMPQKTVSEHGDDDEDDTSGGDSRKRASTAPVREKRGSSSTIISNSQPSNGSHHNGTNETNDSVVKETPIESTQNSGPQTGGNDSSQPPAAESSQLIQQWNEPGNMVTPLRLIPKIVPSSIPSTRRRAMQTPAAKPPPEDLGDSIPETSPVKADGTESEEFRTARECFPQEVDSSPAIVHSRRRAQNAFIASSIPTNATPQKRDRPPRIQDELSEEEIETTIAAPLPPPRKRRRVKTAESMETVQSHVTSTSISENDLEAHRVLALFKDVKMNYFPATVMEPPTVMSDDQEAPVDSEVLVRFDDGTKTTVQLRHIRRFHLEPGDVVKFLIDTCKKFQYIVRRVENDPDVPGGTDISNNNVVVVTQKKAGSAEELRFPIDKIFITGKLFTQFKNRLYLFTNKSSSRKHPVSRNVSSSPHLGRGSLRPISQLFSNMVFAISMASSSKATEKTKETLTDTIIAHNGHVVEEGLDEMFEIAEDVEGDLVLKSEFSSTTFCAVIADVYSRKVKYLQALALGIPCLATKWIECCIKQVRVIYDHANFRIISLTGEYFCYQRVNQNFWEE